MSDPRLGTQLDAAMKFEEFFVPALFGQWTDPMADAAHLAKGQRVLDVACGTGALARTALGRVGPSGRVAGLDSNPAMITVASRIAPEIEWTQGSAEALPYDDASFDAVVSSFGLVYFADRPRALREMMRVLAPGGRLAVAAWDCLENIPAYSIIIALLQHLVGRRAADVLRTPFSLGDPAAFARTFADAGIPVEITTHQGTARYPSARSWVLTDIKAWFPIVDVVLNPEEYEQLLVEAEHALHSFTRPNGTVDFPISIHIAAGAKG